jgi:hypothetical protein
MNATPANAEKTRIKYEGTRVVLLCYAVIIPLLVIFITGSLWYDLNTREPEYIFLMCFTDGCPSLWNVFLVVSKAILYYLSPAFLISVGTAIFVDANR